MSHCVFPTCNIEKTVEFYVTKMGFHAVAYLDANVCLYRDDTEIILTKSLKQNVIPNRELYGYGYNVYFIIK